MRGDGRLRSGRVAAAIEAVPRELDRVCLKCLAKRAADRYSTALDLADDLRHWQGADKSPAVQVQVVLAAPGHADQASPPVTLQGELDDG